MLSICLINHGCATAAEVVVVAANAVSKKKKTCDYDGDCVCFVW